MPSIALSRGIRSRARIPSSSRERPSRKYFLENEFNEDNGVQSHLNQGPLVVLKNFLLQEDMGGLGGTASTISRLENIT